MMGAVLLGALLTPVQGVGESAQIESVPPRSITSGGIKVSLVGNQVHIATAAPVVIYLTSPREAPEGKLEPEKPDGKLRLSQRGPIIIAPTP
jgi:hypothetical protein